MGSEHSLKILAPQPYRFESEGVLKIFWEKIGDSLTESINYEAVCRTAPATPGLNFVLVTTAFLVEFFL